MGSLPNLHELERSRRTLNSEHPDTIHRDTHHHHQPYQQLRAREFRETSCERDTLPVFLHTQILTQTLSSTVAGAPVPGPSSIGGGSVDIPGQSSKHHHRHSLTSRRVLRTRSSGASYNVWDDPMIEHMAAYSPISTRSHRINVLPSYQGVHPLSASRRRDSINSSIGANSIRRLLTINNRTCRHKVPSHVRSKVCKNFTLLAIAHGLISAVLTPIVALQASNSIWHHKEKWIHVGPNIGSMLLSISFLISSGMCFLTTRLIRKLGHTFLIAFSYTSVCFFLLCHLVPSIYTLIPAYVVLGITLGPACVGKFALVVFYANKLSCNQHECNVSTPADTFEEHKVFCNRDQKVRRLGRLFHAAQDLGIIFGASMAAIILSCASRQSTCFPSSASQVTTTTESLPPFVHTSFTSTHTTFTNTHTNFTNTSTTVSSLIPTNVNRTFVAVSHSWMSTQHPTDEIVSDELYNHNEHGERICGADLCPVWSSTIDHNDSFYDDFLLSSTGYGEVALIILYLSFATISVSLMCLSGKGEKSFRMEKVKGMTDTLLFAGPMAYFIGTEQGYMLGDFTRAYVTCSLGVPMVAGALVGMGIMQAIVSCTLSMLLRHTKRLVILAAGFFFHSCLLLVLSRWKPSSDDSALFYVIAAGWGACNAMWETLLFALVTLTHTNHVAEIISPLQGLKFLGLGVTFVAHSFLCENPKILILVIVLVLSVPPYAMLEIRLESQRKAQVVSL